MEMVFALNDATKRVWEMFSPRRLGVAPEARSFTVPVRETE